MQGQKETIIGFDKLRGTFTGTRTGSCFESTVTSTEGDAALRDSLEVENGNFALRGT